MKFRSVLILNLSVPASSLEFSDIVASRLQFLRYRVYMCVFRSIILYFPAKSCDTFWLSTGSKTWVYFNCWYLETGGLPIDHWSFASQCKQRCQEIYSSTPTPPPLLLLNPPNLPSPPKKNFNVVEPPPPSDISLLEKNPFVTWDFNWLNAYPIRLLLII